MTEGWSEVDGRLCRTFELESFPAAIAFVGRVAEIAESQDHHPDIDIRWRTVHLGVNTHDQGGAITDKDHLLAEAVNRL